MKPDLSPDDRDGLLRQAETRRQAEQAEYDRDVPMSLTGGWLPLAFIAAVIAACMCIYWSFAK